MQNDYIDDPVEEALERGKLIYCAIANEKGTGSQNIPFTVLNGIGKNDDGDEFSYPIMMVGIYDGNLMRKTIPIPIYGDHLCNFLDLLNFCLKKLPSVFDNNEGSKLIRELKKEIMNDDKWSEDVKERMKYEDVPRYFYFARNEIGDFGVDFHFDTINFLYAGYATLGTYITIHDLNQVDWADAELPEITDLLAPRSDDLVVCGFVVSRSLSLFHFMKPFDLRLKK